MPVVRELIALLTAKVDPASFREAESRMFRLRTAVGGAVAGFATAQAYEWAQMSARFEDARRIMEANGQSLDDLRAKSKGLFSDFTLVTEFNRAEQFGLGKYFTDMIKIADASSTLLGQTQDYMLQRLTTGLAKMSPARIDELGILVSLREVSEEVAEEQGVSVKQLDQQLRKQGVINEVMDQGAKIVEKVNKAGAIGAQTYDRNAAAVNRMQLSIGKLANVAVQILAPLINKVADWTDRIGRSTNAQRFIGELATAFGILGDAIGVVAYDLMALMNIVASVPGSGYAVLALATAALGAQLVSFAGFAARALPWMGALVSLVGSAGLAGAFTSLQWAVVAFASVWGPVALAIAAFAIPAGIALLALEEIFAVFDDEKLGMFEEFAGRWGDLAIAIASVQETGFFGKMWQWFKLGIVEGIGWLDTLISSVATLSMALVDLGSGDWAAASVRLRDAGKMWKDEYAKQMQAEDILRRGAQAGNMQLQPGQIRPESITNPTISTPDPRANSLEVQQNITINGTNMSTESLLEKLRAKGKDALADSIKQAMQESTFVEVP